MTCHVKIHSKGRTRIRVIPLQVLKDALCKIIPSRRRLSAPTASVSKIDPQYRWSIVVLFLLCAVCFVFWPQIIGAGVFIGESDRLNSYLNIRLAEYDALIQFGRVPDWDSRMFGGFSLAALHWMNPGRDPIPYLLQFLSRDNIFWALGFTPILLIVAACLTSFLYIRTVINADAGACVGALAYGFSVFSLHRAAQVDNAELTVVLLPLGLLCLRRTTRNTLAGPFAGLALVMTALAFWGFLQEVAYTFVFFGVYALYRSALLARQDNRSWLAPVVVMAAASTVALVFSAPRLITIGHEVGLLRRATTQNYYGYDQILRFFHEGIYGRYFEEGRLLGHGMNLSEGLQLVSSSALSLFVCIGIARPRSYAEIIGAVLFYAIFLVMMPAPGHVAGTLHISVELYRLIFFGSILFGLAYLYIRHGSFRIDSAQRPLVPPRPRPEDTTFHLFSLTGVLFLILIPEGTEAVHYLFGRADFTHTRLSLLMLLPLCSLFATYLTELKTLPIFTRVKKRHTGLYVPLLVIFSAGVAYAIYGPLFDWLLPYDIVKIFFLSGNELLPSAIAQLAATAALLGGLAVLLTRRRLRNTNVATMATIAIGVFVIVEILLYAHLRMAGPQTWTYPVPFRGFNYLNVGPSVLRPPDEAKLAAYNRVFETEKYRIVSLSDNTHYTGTNIPHIAQFWKARSIGGYGTGVAERLTRLPWPPGVQTLRTIDFLSTRGLDESIFALLAFLNVKYLLSLTSDVYFNFPSLGTTTDIPAIQIGGVKHALQSSDIGGLRFNFLTNPIEVLPRHFFAEQTIGSADAPMPTSHPHWGPSPVGGIGFLHIFVNQTDDLRHKSYVEGLNVGKVTAYDTSGQLDVIYRGDRIDVSIIPSTRERFLVINQTLNPNWAAYAGSRTLAVLPTNAVMSGVQIPPQTDHIQLRFEPFSSSRTALILMATAVLGLIGGFFALRSWQRRQVN